MVQNAGRSAYVYDASLTQVTSMICINLATLIFELGFYTHANISSAVENIKENVHMLSSANSSQYFLIQWF